MKFLPVAAAVFAVFTTQQAFAADAKSTIDGFDNALLDVMKNADKLGYKGRYDRIAPVIVKTYDLPLMARISVGPEWSTLTPDQQAKITEAFKSLSIATFASRFDGYGGESFQITGESPANADDIVDTKMLRPNDDAVDLNYRLRKTGDDWKIIDVYLSGTISQLANYRSEFSTTLRSGEKINLDALKGKVVVLDFWGTWCTACRASLPLLRSLAASVDPEKAVIISIDEDDPKEQWEQFLQSNWSQVYDGDRSMRTAFAVDGFPRYFVLSKDGIISAQFKGWNQDSDAVIKAAISRGLAQ